jgi:hypothetical protein
MRESHAAVTHCTDLKPAGTQSPCLHLAAPSVWFPLISFKQLREGMSNDYQKSLVMQYWYDLSVSATLVAVSRIDRVSG